VSVEEKLMEKLTDKFPNSRKTGGRDIWLAKNGQLRAQSTRHNSPTFHMLPLSSPPPSTLPPTHSRLKCYATHETTRLAGHVWKKDAAIVHGRAVVCTKSKRRRGTHFPITHAVHMCVQAQVEKEQQQQQQRLQHHPWTKTSAHMCMVYERENVRGKSKITVLVSLHAVVYEQILKFKKNNLSVVMVCVHVWKT
jgi:hypothetical protein